MNEKKRKNKKTVRPDSNRHGDFTTPHGGNALLQNESPERAK